MTTNFQLAKQVADHVQLLSVTLNKANVDAKFDPTEPPNEIGLSQSYRAIVVEPDLGEKVNKFSVVVDFKFFATSPIAHSEHESSEGDLATLDAAFLLVYEVPGDLEVEERCFKHFAEVNGPYNAWPYWRELVQSVTGRIGLAGITVPVFHPRPSEIQEDDD